MRSKLYFYERFMGFFTLVNGVIVVTILSYFSFNFISKVFTGSIAIALILAFAVEITKIITSFYASSFSARGIESVRGNLLNNSLRIFAIILSSVFCLSEVANLTTRPNYDKVKTTRLAETEEQVRKRRQVLMESYQSQKDALLDQIKSLSDLRYPTTGQKERLADLDRQLQEVIAKEQETLQESNAQLASMQDHLVEQLDLNPAVNNSQINDILFSIGISPDNNGQYSKYYRYFTLFSALFLTIFLEFASITTVRNFTKFMYEQRRKY